MISFGFPLPCDFQLTDITRYVQKMWYKCIQLELILTLHTVFSSHLENRTWRTGEIAKQKRQSIHSAVCLTTGPKPLLNQALHILRSRASSFRCEYPLLSLRSSNSFLRPFPRLPVNSKIIEQFPIDSTPK
jgi:hypothetical protein